MGALGDSVERQWYSKPHWLLLLVPLNVLYITLSYLRRKYFSVFRKPASLPVPIVVIGNITVGGTGKTPLIIALVQALRERGYKPGVIARGYGANVEGAIRVDAESSASEVGDEPLLVYRSCQCPVAVGKSRLDSARLLIDSQACDIILSDDGMQHYALARDVEVAVVDTQRLLGNGWRLPVGPLRESRKRFSEVDLVFCNGGLVSKSWLPEGKVFASRLVPANWINVKTGESLSLADLDLRNAQAVAAIGNPERFFQTLKTLGFKGPTASFPDHYSFSSTDFEGFAATVLLMTEKDAVKCSGFARDDWWALAVRFELPEEFLERLWGLLG